ncbi:MAG: PQQ-dependent sugar dehydrogenase [Planctomycetes bacterium]|nr:PQQ-dependent sugar dehydrogenase [Planctomycetota bacterium]
MPSRLAPRGFAAALSSLALSLVPTSAVVAQGNTPPNAPRINEPSPPPARVSPFDVHMETLPFADPDPGDQHAASDWELWTTSPSQRIWTAPGVTGGHRVHIHLGDGAFTGSHAGRTFLLPSTRYQLRVRHKDDSGDPLTEWSTWSSGLFDTVAFEQPTPLEIDDVASSPLPLWTDPNSVEVDLPATSDASLRLESPSGQLLLRLDASAAAGNAITNPPALAQHEAVRVVVSGGTRPGFVALPETNLTILENGCAATTIRLPVMTLFPGVNFVFWVSLEGATYTGSLAQTTPSFTSPARNLTVPWVVREVGWVVDVVASNLRLPVNLAFVPVPGAQPGDPKFYVSELYGTIRTVTNDGTVVTYATGLLNYTPNGAFPGAGEQGLTGIAVDPQSGDVFAAMLQFNAAIAANDPRIVRFHSTDGGRTASSQQTILAMPGESQGQSHQISRLEIVNGELFCHMGDGFVTATARSLTSFRGKILRLNLDGSPVVQNPFFDGGARDARDYVYAYGVRNPFGGAWRAADGFRYVVENGPSVDRFARIVMGRDYLWNGTDASMASFALYTWNPARGPVNLAFVQPQTFGGSGFPAGKQGHAFVTESGPTYAFGRQANGKHITEFVLDAAGNRVSGPTPFVDYVGDGYATAVGLAAGPDGLYFTELYRDRNTAGPTTAGARVLRIRYGDPSDCNRNGEADWCEIASGLEHDCNGNRIPDVCDLASGSSRDFDGNLVPDECDPLEASTDELSITTGGRVDFGLDAGVAFAGASYALVGSISGTSPGTIVEGIRLPLNIAGDPWFFLTIVAANSPSLQGTIGVLDTDGGSSAALVLPAGLPASLAGATLHHAFAALDPQSGRLAFASNAVPLRLLP